MSALSNIDSLCLPSMVDGNPVAFKWPEGGPVMTGTVGARNTDQFLIEGGTITNENWSILVPVSEFDPSSIPIEGSKLEVAVDSFGIPCAAEDVATWQSVRVKSRSRVGAGITFRLSTSQR